jgi:hypothetical protein
MGKVGSPCLIIPPLIKVLQQPTWPFDPVHPTTSNPASATSLRNVCRVELAQSLALKPSRPGLQTLLLIPRGIVISNLCGCDDDSGDLAMFASSQPFRHQPRVGCWHVGSLHGCACPHSLGTVPRWQYACRWASIRFLFAGASFADMLLRPLDGSEVSSRCHEPIRPGAHRTSAGNCGYLVTSSLPIRGPA